MSRRLVTDAKIVLERAGYELLTEGYIIWVGLNDFIVGYLDIEGGTVDNAHVVELLEERGYNEFGYRRD